MLDVSVKTGILWTFKELQRSRNHSILYISHDLSTINYLANRTMIMYLGKIVERGPTQRVIHDPAHPYTETLLQAVKHSHGDTERVEAGSTEEVPTAVNLPSGCRFAYRCTDATEEGETEEPALERIHGEAVETGREVACYHRVAGEKKSIN